LSNFVAFDSTGCTGCIGTKVPGIDTKSYNLEHMLEQVHTVTIATCCKSMLL